ncbi:MAG: LysM domain-containing protein [Rhodospirillales bacterium]|nr:MAG: LysM domain-containing protein [Rhodospirillales bacterium]
MTDPVQALFQAGVLKDTAFPATSRYHDVPTAKLTLPDGQVVVYLRRRIVPAPERFALIREHTVQQGERLDAIAARYLGDPEQFWRLCDANGVLRPDELIDEEGRRIRITLPDGVPGPSEN